MRIASIRSSVAVFLIAAACADHARVTAPLSSTALEIAEATPARAAIVCNKIWNVVTGGSWNTAANWLPAGVPTATDDVCITLAGTYTVFVQASGTAKTITIGNPVGVQTVAIQGTGSGTVLTAVESMDNAGVITLSWANGTNGTAASVAVTNGLLTNTGTIRSLTDAIGSPRRILANLLNLGTIDIQHGTQLDKANGVFENRGSWIVQASRTMSMTGNNNRFLQKEGTLTLTGNFTVSSATFEFAGGEIVNDVTLASGTLVIADGCTGAGAFTMSGGNTLVGNLGTAQSIKILGTGTGSSLTSATSFENAGLIELAWGNGTNGTAATLAVTDGVLTNSGTIRTLTDAIGSPRHLKADIVNTGLVDIQHSTLLSKDGGVYENRGAWTIQTGRTQTMAQGTTTIFRQSEGTLTVTGNFTVSSNTFEFNGGDIVNDVALVNGTLKLGPDNSGAGDFAVSGGSTLVGNVGPGTIVRIQGTGTGSVLTSAGSFINDGIIEQGWASGTNGTHSTLAITDGVLTNNGTLRTVTDPIGAPRFIRANFVNNGTISIGQSTTISRVDGSYENRGALDVGQGRTLTIDASTGQTFRQAAGKLALTGSMTVNSNTFEVAGGEMTGNAPVLSNGTLRFTGAATGVLSARGTVALVGDVPSGFTTRINTLPSVSTVLTAAGDFTNRGVIEIQATGSTNGIGVTFAVTSGRLTNEGTLRVLSDAFGGTPRTIAGSIFNTGTIEILSSTTFAKTGGTYENAGTISNTRTVTISGLSQTFVNTGTITGGGSFNLSTMTMRASGNVQANLNLTSVAAHIGKSGPATLNVTGLYRMISGGSLDVDLTNDAAPGTGHDRLNVTGTATLLGTLNVTRIDNQCIDPSKSFEIMTYTSRAGDFTVKNGLNLGDGRTLTAVPGAASYKLNSAGTLCVAPDVTPPTVVPMVTGTLGNDGWYVSDVTVSWNVSDDESAITSSTGCGSVTLTTDSNGQTYTCSATSAGGTTSQSVTVKRDATAPVVTAGAMGEPNIHGWYGTPIGVKYSASDAMSGIAGETTVLQLVDSEGANQTVSRSFSDRAGNLASGSVTGLNIDLTWPVWAVTSRSPAPNAAGWNNSDVTVTFSVSDELSGMETPTTVVFAFNQEGANQLKVQEAVDKAGHAVQLVYGNVNIDKTAPVVSVTRSPLPDAGGWNDTPVTATWTASDALSGLDGAATATHLFDQDGAGQSASRSFTDRAGNTASATISNINIDTRPPVLAPSCSVTPAEITPPNNKMVAVRATIGGAGVMSFKLRSVVNNETGTADVDGWTLGSADVDGYVKATRLGSGTGRTYTLTYDVFGARNATGSCAVQVKIAHDQRK